MSKPIQPTDHLNYLANFIFQWLRSRNRGELAPALTMMTAESLDDARGELALILANGGRPPNWVTQPGNPSMPTRTSPNEKTLGDVVLFHFKRRLPAGEVVIQSRPSTVIGYGTDDWDDRPRLQLDVCFAHDDIGPGGEPYDVRTRYAYFHNSYEIPTHNTWSHAGLWTEITVLGRAP
jgi:hypothetical protein